MIYIIISNVGMALMMILVYFRYSRFRITSNNEIRDLRKMMDKEIEGRREAENKLLDVTKFDTDKIEKLLREIDELRKEKEGEVRLRFEAENQIDIALQRTEDIQKRMNDWRLVQDAVMKDSKDAIVKIGNDLYKKLNDSYKVEIETNKNLLGKVTKNISEFFDKFSAEKPSKSKAETGTADNVSEVKKSSSLLSKEAQKLIAENCQTMNLSGRMVNKDYFIAANFNPQKAKLFLCDIAFSDGKKLYIMDFKSCAYIEDYQNSKDKVASADILKGKLDKYFAYLKNAKYLASILKVIPAEHQKLTKSIVIALPSKHAVNTLKEIKYHDKPQKLGLEMMNPDEINNIIL